jgi:23S rRNA (cytosine1962-C5)-methyltransferase
MNNATPRPIESLLDRALEARAGFSDPRHESAWRLFNGFYEGDPELVVDIYGRTLVIFNHADPPQKNQARVNAVRAHLASRLPWVRCAVLKERKSSQDQYRFGTVIAGEAPDDRIKEYSVWYAIDLLMNQDASFYLDTRNLRAWALENLAGKSVLNTFAYTGSLGVAARGAGAQKVVHTDLNRKYLNLAKRSFSLNGFPIDKSRFITGDFWTVTARMRRERQLFDCVFIDPPFFITARRGAVHSADDFARLLNKVRPLVQQDGWLIAINNALFVSGSEYVAALESLCAEGYMQIESLIPAPQDVTGAPHTRVSFPPTDTSPFNHPTKIAVLRVFRKEG